MPNIAIINNFVVSEAIVLEIYQKLYSLIAFHKDQALHAKKELLIVFGENHYCEDAFLIKTLVLNIAKIIGLQNYYSEQCKMCHRGTLLACALNANIINEFVFSLFKKIAPKQNYASSDASLFCERTYRNANYLQFNMIAIDDLHHCPDINLRNAVMAENLKFYKQSGVLICGFAHIPGMIEDYDLKREYHFLMINASSIKPESRVEILEKLKFGYFDRLKSDFLKIKAHREYDSMIALQRSADYFSPEKCTQISKTNDGNYQISASLLNPKATQNDIKVRVDIKSLDAQLGKTSLTKVFFIVQSGWRTSVEFFRSLCFRPSGISKERLAIFREREIQAIQAFNQIATYAPESDRNNFKINNTPVDMEPKSPSKLIDCCSQEETSPRIIPPIQFTKIHAKMPLIEKRLRAQHNARTKRAI